MRATVQDSTQQTNKQKHTTNNNQHQWTTLAHTKLNSFEIHTLKNYSDKRYLTRSDFELR